MPEGDLAGVAGNEVQSEGSHGVGQDARELEYSVLREDGRSSYEQDRQHRSQRQPDAQRHRPPGPLRLHDRVDGTHTRTTTAFPKRPSGLAISTATMSSSGTMIWRSAPSDGRYAVESD